MLPPLGTIWAPTHTPGVLFRLMAGSIEARGPNRWRLRVSAGYDPVTRKRRVIRRTVEGTKAEAEQQLARLVVEASDGMWVGTSTTVADLLDAWLPQARLSPETRYDYGLVVKNQIKPNIGHVQLHKLRAHHLDALYVKLEAGGLGTARIRRVHTVMRSSLGRAVKWTWIARNPAVDASPPPVEQVEIEPPTPAQLRALIVNADAHSPFLGVWVRLAAELGARRGELCALKWTDVDLAGGTVFVRRTVGVVDGAAYEKELKNKKRRKPVPISRSMVELLRAWRLATAADRLASGDPEGWVFATQAIERSRRREGFFRPDRVSKLFRVIADDAGLRHVHPHSLRHYVATQLLDANVNAGVVARRLGHARTSTTTDIYGDVVDESSRAAAETIDRINRGETGS